MPAFNRKELVQSFFTTLSPADKIKWLKYRNACDASLFFFIRLIGGSVPKQGGDISEYLHKPICDRLQDPSVKRQSFFAPRGWMKSTVGRWHWIWEYLQNPEIRILVPSEKKETAGKWIRDTGEQIARNDMLRWVYPELQDIDQRYIKTHQWSGDGLLLPRNGIYPEATISVTGIRGASQGGHFDLITPDDLVGEKGYESPLVLEDARRWFDNIEELLINPDRDAVDGSRIALRGTHWTVGDFGIFVQNEYPEYKWYIIPCLKDSSLADTDNITWLQREESIDGESNWPEMFSTKHYSDMRANPMKEVVFWAQHMNCPRDSTTLTKFDGAWLRYYKFAGSGDDLRVVCEDDGESFSVREMPLWGFIDPGGFAEMKVAQRGSRNAIVVGGQPRNSVKKFVVETWAGRIKDPSIFMDKLFEINDRLHVRGWMVETVGSQKYIFRDIQHERVARKKGLCIMELPSVVTKGAKDSDILGLLQPMQNGEIYVHRSMKELTSEIREYPNGLTVDLIDMTGKWLKQRTHRASPDANMNKPRVRTLLQDGASPAGY